MAGSLCEISAIAVLLMAQLRGVRRILEWMVAFGYYEKCDRFPVLGEELAIEKQTF